MRDMNRPTTSQLGMLDYTVRNEYRDLLKPQKDERGTDMKLIYLIRWAEQRLDKYQISGFINILGDEDFKREWRKKFFVDFLKAKGFDEVEIPTTV